MHSYGEATIRVVLVAPQITCWGLQQLVQSSPHLELVGTASSLETLEQQGLHQRADVLVVALDDPSRQDHLVDVLGKTAAHLVVLTGMPDVGALDRSVLRGL